MGWAGSSIGSPGRLLCVWPSGAVCCWVCCCDWQAAALQHSNSVTECVSSGLRRTSVTSPPPCCSCPAPPRPAPLQLALASDKASSGPAAIIQLPSSTSASPAFSFPTSFGTANSVVNMETWIVQVRRSLQSWGWCQLLSQAQSCCSVPGSVLCAPAALLAPRCSLPPAALPPASQRMNTAPPPGPAGAVRPGAAVARRAAKALLQRGRHTRHGGPGRRRAGVRAAGALTGTAATLIRVRAMQQTDGAAPAPTSAPRRLPPHAARHPAARAGRRARHGISALGQHLPRRPQGAAPGGALRLVPLAAPRAACCARGLPHRRLACSLARPHHPAPLHAPPPARSARTCCSRASWRTPTASPPRWAGAAAGWAGVLCEAAPAPAQAPAHSSGTRARC
jgi:hypothetical protein